MPCSKQFGVRFCSNCRQQRGESTKTSDAGTSCAGSRPNRMHNSELASRIARQDGVITFAQAQNCGLTDDAVQYLVKTGSWRLLSIGVYFSEAHRMSHKARLRAAVFASGKDAVAYGPSAAWWHGLIATAPARPTVTIPVGRQVRRGQRFDVRRRTLIQSDRTTLRGLAITALPLTILEAAVALPNGSVLMDRALQTRTSLPKLEGAHDRNSGRAGSGSARRLLRVAASGGRSEAEKLVHRLMHSHGISGWSTQVKSCGYDIDVAFVTARVVIEIDGWAFHRDSARNSRDMKRQNALANAGWRVLRFDWHRLTNDPDGVVADIRAAISTKLVNQPY